MKNSGLRSFREAIAAYFESRRTPARDADGSILTRKGGGVVYEEKAATVTGLALALGCSSREELFDIKEGQRKALVERALMRIEEAAEEKLFCKDTFQGAKLFLSANFKRWREGEEESEGSVDLGVCSVWAE